MGCQALADLFAVFYREIEARQEDPDVDKQEIVTEVTRIEAETAKGEQTNLDKLERKVSKLAKMAPDIVDVIAASPVGPLAGTAAVLSKIIKNVNTSEHD